MPSKILWLQKHCLNYPWSWASSKLKLLWPVNSKREDLWALMLGSSLKRDDTFIYFILFLSFLFFCFALNERKRLEHLKGCAFFLVRKQSCLASPWYQYNHMQVFYYLLGREMSLEIDATCIFRTLRSFLFIPLVTSEATHNTWSSQNMI